MKSWNLLWLLMVINQNLGTDPQYHTIALEPAKNIQLRISSFAAQRNPFLNNELANNNKTPKAPMKPKAQPKAMPKGKKWPEILKVEKMNWQIDKKEPMNLFIRKSNQLFNLEDKNASLRAEVTQDKKESNRLKVENRKLNARLEESMNAACIQSEKMKEKIRQLNKKLDKV